MLTNKVPARELVDRLRVAIMRLSRRLRQEAQEGLSPSMLSMLATIHRHSSMTLGELAEAERVQPPTVSRVVARLEDDGLIARAADPGDRRVARVRLTPRGKQLLDRARARQARNLEQRLARLQPDELQRVEEVARMLERLAEDE